MDDNTTLIKLIKENKGLICSIIHKYTSYYEFDDLYQVSIIGMMKAYKNYKEEYGVKFSTYAYQYILSEVLSFVNQSKLIKTSKDYQKLYRKIIEARNVLTQRLMKEPSESEISLFLEVDESLIRDVLRYQDCVRSLDEIVSIDGKKVELIDSISCNKDDINFDSIYLKEELKSLSKDELLLIQMRYYEDKTQSEVASLLGCNQVHVSRSEKKILKKLKNNLCRL